MEKLRQRIKKPIPVTTYGEVPDIIDEIKRLLSEQTDDTNTIELRALLRRFEKTYTYAEELEEYDRGAIKFGICLCVGLLGILGSIGSLGFIIFNT
jgi:hypothetical protein